LLLPTTFTDGLRVWKETGQGSGADFGTRRDSIVNRLLLPYLLDAICAYEEGVGVDLRDIDNAMKLGCGYPDGAVYVAGIRRARYDLLHLLM